MKEFFCSSIFMSNIIGSGICGHNNKINLTNLMDPFSRLRACLARNEDWIWTMFNTCPKNELGCWYENILQQTNYGKTSGKLDEDLSFSESDYNLLHKIDPIIKSNTDNTSKSSAFKVELKSLFNSFFFAAITASSGFVQAGFI